MGMADSLRPGTTLADRYVLSEFLGCGLGGETWKATPKEGGAPVALKVIPQNADWRVQRDLLSEATFLRELDHPNVLRYLGIVDLPGGRETFLITEFIAGGNLWRWVRDHGACGPALAAELLLQIGEGLSAVHARGILHRDLKPQNVLVQPRDGGAPRLLVADFGVSRRVVMSVAAPTKVAGTPGYSAPEVWSGGPVSAAVDVYSLGAIGWFLLTGAEPEPTIGSTHLDPRDLFDRVGPETRAHAGPLLAMLASMLALQPASRPGLPRVLAGLAVAAGQAVATPAAVRTAERPSPTLSPAGDRSVLDEDPLPPRRSWPIGAAALLLGGFGVLCAGGLMAYFSRDVAPSEPASPAPVAAAIAPAESPAPAPVVAPAPPPVAAALEPAALEPAAPRVAAAPPSPPAAVLPQPGRIARLRVGLDSPNGLPADARLVVTAPGGSVKESSSTQVLVSDSQSGTAHIAIRSATQTLAEASLLVPPGEEVRVLCTTLAADFAGLRCSVRE